jgi:hypothetical protein
VYQGGRADVRPNLHCRLGGGEESSPLVAMAPLPLELITVYDDVLQAKCRSEQPVRLGDQRVPEIQRRQGLVRKVRDMERGVRFDVLGQGAWDKGTEYKSRDACDRVFGYPAAGYQVAESRGEKGQGEEPADTLQF